MATHAAPPFAGLEVGGAPHPMDGASARIHGLKRERFQGVDADTGEVDYRALKVLI